MPQDTFTLRLNAAELNTTLKGGRINRINQPGREELSFIIYTGKGTLKLVLNANASDCGVYFSENDRENPLVAPNFCMLLRKHLQGAQITGVALVGFERILQMRFSCVSDFSCCERILYAEVMGKYSNILLVENDIILGALKTTTPDDGCKRLIMPGAKYVLPQPQDKTDPRDEAALRALFAHAPEHDLARFLFANVAGLAPCTAELIAQGYDGGDLTAHVRDFIFSDEVQPCVVERDGAVVDFHARMVKNAIPFTTLSQAQLYFYSKKQNKNALEAARRKLLSAQTQAIKKQEKRLAQIAERRRTAADAEENRKKGELLTANLWALERGMKSCELTDYYDETAPKIKISLDERLTPSQNAQAYFKRYQKQKRTLEALAPQEEEARKELDYLESLSPLLLLADCIEDLKAMEEELVAAGLIKLQNPAGRGAKKKPEIPFRVSEADGFTILMGRSNLQNDKLVRQSAPSDVWLHAQRLHSAHVVIRTNGKQVPECVLSYAAALCAKHSAGRGDKIPVDWCYVKNVRKSKGAKAGFVTYTDFTTVLGDPKLAEKHDL